MAVACALLFGYGGSQGWWRVEGLTATRPWHEVNLFPYGDRVDPNPGEAGSTIGWLVLLPCAVAWLWAPFGGHLGRIMTVIVFAYACYLIAADLPTFSADGEPPGVARDRAVLDALLHRDGWEWHGLEGTRLTDRIGGRVVGDLDIVALRERVQPGATLSLAAAVGGLTVGTVSLLMRFVSNTSMRQAPTAPG